MLLGWVPTDPRGPMALAESPGPPPRNRSTMPNHIWPPNRPQSAHHRHVRPIDRAATVTWIALRRRAWVAPDRGSTAMRTGCDDRRDTIAWPGAWFVWCA